MFNKILLLMFCWSCIFMMNAKSEKISLEYKILNDSNQSNSLEVKNEVLEVYQSIIYGTDTQSRPGLVKENIDLFKFEEDYEVSIDYNTIIISIGNAQGKVISGEFDWVMCSDNIQTTSFIKELLSK